MLSETYVVAAENAQDDILLKITLIFQGMLDWLATFYT